MAIFQSDAAKGLQTPPNAHLAGVENVTNYSYTFATSGYSVNDIIELACIPAGHRVVEVVEVADDLDSHGTPTFAYDIGVMSGKWQDPTSGSRTCGAEFFSGDTTGRAGGVARPTLASAYRVGGAAVARSIGLKINALPATAAAGKIDLIVRTTPA